MLLSLRPFSLCIALIATSSISGNEPICSGVEEFNDHSSTLLVSVQAGTLDDKGNVDEDNIVKGNVNEDSKRESAFHSSYFSLVGSSQSQIAAKINKFISSHTSVSSVVPCAELSAIEIASLASELKVFTDMSIKHFFPEDDGRQVYLNPWDIHRFEEDSPVRRAAQCAETVKLWAHHVPNSAKTSSMNVVLPSMPSNFNLSGLTVAGLEAEAKLYNKSLSCVAGHTVRDVELEESADEDPYAYDWPRWPSMMHFRAKGHGPYPFWQFGELPQNVTDSWDLNLSFNSPFLYYPGNEMEVWHNTQQKATKFYHSRCEWEWLGFSENAGKPCAALMLNAFGPNAKWYLYTADSETMASDEEFCCESSWTNENGRALGTVNRKFVDEMVYLGVDAFQGDYYKGQSKQYVLAMKRNYSYCPECGDEPELSINVFYETDMEGRPLRFGEWGQKLALNGYLHDSDFPLMYEEFDPESFTDRTMQHFSDSVFDIPSVCFTGPHGCHPGRTKRENSVFTSLS